MSKITIVNNKNTSPAKNLENEKREKGLIVEDINLEDLDYILEILEKEKLIKYSNLDRQDFDTEKPHYHYYFDSDVNNNTLQSIIKNYIENKKIDYEKIEQQKEIQMQNRTYKIAGILDKKSEKVSKNFENLIENNENNIIYVAKDKDNLTKYKDINSNLGISKNKVLTDLSHYDFTFYFDKEINFDEEKIKESLEESLKRYKDLDTSTINLKTEIKDNKLTIDFDNILKSKEDDKIFMFSKKNMNDILEVFLKNLSEKEEVKILSEKMRYYKTEEEILSKKILKNNDIKEETKTKTLKQFKETKEQNEENKIDDKHINFYNELKQLNNEDFEKEIEKLIEAEIKIDEIRDILGAEIVEAKLKEIKEKLEVIEIVKKEKEDKEELNKKITELNETKKDLEERLKQEQEEKNKVIENNINLEKELTKEKEEKENIINILEETKEDLTKEKDNNNKLSKEKTELEERLKQEQEEKERITKEYEDFKEKSKIAYKLLEQEKQELYEKYKEEREINRTLQKEIENKDSIIEKLNNTIKEQSEKITKTLKENETLKKVKNELENKLNSFMEQLKNAKNYITSKEEENEKLAKTLKQASEYTTELESEIEELEKKAEEQNSKKNNKRTLPKSPK